MINVNQRKRTRTVTDLVEELESLGIASKSLDKPFADPASRARSTAQDRNLLGTLKYGVVMYSVPYCNWYRVHVEGVTGVIGCTAAASNTSPLPIGVRSSTTIPPYSPVLVHVVPNSDVGIILAVLPFKQGRNDFVRPDWWSQDGQSGFRKEDMYRFPFEGLLASGGIADYSNNRPLDSTNFEYSLISGSGIGLLIDEFQAVLRVNEMCGVFANYFDSFLRIAGVNMDLMSSGFLLSSRNDEGELQTEISYATYPWEALGALQPDVQFAREYSDAEFQLESAKGKVDLAEDTEDIEAFSRVRQFFGYLGQGGRRELVVPSKLEGLRRYSDTSPDIGLFTETIGLDGSVALRAAKSFTIEKTIYQPIAKRRRLPEDQQESSDNPENYSPSGHYGEGSESHKQRDPLEASASDEKPKLLAAGADDLGGKQQQWDHFHPFSLHENDFHAANQELLQNTGIRADQDYLNFGLLDSNDKLVPPEIELDIDHKQSGKYTQRKATIKLLDDGGILFQDGYGSRLLMQGGDIIIDCPGDVHLSAGKSFISQAADTILKSYGSCDISATKNDIRLAANKNMQLTAGDGNEGGVLIESKSQGEEQDYQGRIGEEVVSRGIVLKSNSSSVSTLASNIYLRTGSDGENSLDSGNIILDAHKGRREVIFKARTVQTYTLQGVFHAIGAQGETPAYREVAVFTSNYTRVGGTMVCDGIVSLGENVSSGSWQIEGVFATTSSDGQAGIGRSRSGSVSQALNEQRQQIQRLVEDRNTGHRLLFANSVYRSSNLGNDETISNIGFSFRDTPQQYRIENFQFLEPRWQQMVRFNMAAGGVNWEDPGIEYQGRTLRAWPGSGAYAGDSVFKGFMRISKYTYYDPNRRMPIEDLGIYQSQAEMGKMNAVAFINLKVNPRT